MITMTIPAAVINAVAADGLGGDLTFELMAGSGLWAVTTGDQVWFYWPDGALEHAAVGP